MAEMATNGLAGRRRWSTLGPAPLLVSALLLLLAACGAGAEEDAGRSSSSTSAARSEDGDGNRTDDRADAAGADAPEPATPTRSDDSADEGSGPEPDDDQPSDPTTPAADDGADGDGGGGGTTTASTSDATTRSTTTTSATTVVVDEEPGETSTSVASSTTAAPDPCRPVAPPDPWRVEAGAAAELRLQLTGDCGPVTWGIGYPLPAGVEFADGIVRARPEGPTRSEYLSLVARRADGEDVGFFVTLFIVDDQPDAEPCGLDVDRSLVQNGTLTLVVPIGATRSTTIQPIGSCGDHRWEHGSLPAGVRFAGNVLTVVGTEPVGSNRFILTLRPEVGTALGANVRVDVVE